MVQSLQLGPQDPAKLRNGVSRLNRLPIVVTFLLVLAFLGVVFVGLSWRGLSTATDGGDDRPQNAPATSFGDQLKRGIGDGIIGDPEQTQFLQPRPNPSVEPQPSAADILQAPTPANQSASPPNLDEDWRRRLAQEQEEQYLREQNRQRMARLQSEATALDSPLAIDLSAVHARGETAVSASQSAAGRDFAASKLDTEALRLGLMGIGGDPNGQGAKGEFFNQDIQELGYLPNQVVPPVSRYELKRGSVIPATMISGLNSDLPGRIIAQVSQNVYDSATGRLLLVPQGSRLFGRYDSRVSFGQERVLAIWTDLIFPDGSTLQLGGMAGTDAEGYGGFHDKVDRHLWRTFGSAALVALIGAGIDMAIPESSTLSARDTASDAARRNFAESFGRAAEQTISKNLNVQPTIRIRPGYKFNVLVDQDIAFPRSFPAR